MPSSFLIAVALGHGAIIHTCSTFTSAEEIDSLTLLLRGLVRLGHVACFTVEPAPERTDAAGVTEALRHWVGPDLVDAVLGSAGIAAVDEPPPAFLMPVWAFDHERDGMPASTARFLGLDLEVIATPSAEEEVGVALPGRDGLWLIRARPTLF